MLVDTFVLGVSNNMLSEKTKRKDIQKRSCDNYNGNGTDCNQISQQ